MFWKCVLHVCQGLITFCTHVGYRAVTQWERGRCQVEKISSVCSSSSNHNHGLQNVVGVLCGGLLVFDCLGSHLRVCVEELAITSSLQGNKMHNKTRLQTLAVHLCCISKFCQTFYIIIFIIITLSHSNCSWSMGNLLNKV